MTSSLTHQSQLSFGAAHYLPIDLSQPVYGGLYPAPSTHQTPAAFHHFIPGSFCLKDLQEAYVCAAGVLPQESKTEAHVGTDPTGKTLSVASSKPPTDYAGDSDSGSISSTSPASTKPLAGGGGGDNQSQKKKKLLVRDDAYYERRRKNNDAAKRSRDSRRRKEDEVAIRAALLEQENLRLRFEVERLRTEIDRHRIVALNAVTVPVSASAAAAAATTLSLMTRRTT